MIPFLHTFSVVAACEGRATFLSQPGEYKHSGGVAEGHTSEGDGEVDPVGFATPQLVFEFEGSGDADACIRSTIDVVVTSADDEAAYKVLPPVAGIEPVDNGLCNSCHIFVVLVLIMVWDFPRPHDKDTISRLPATDSR